MTILHFLLIVVLLAILTLASYVNRLYSEMGKFLSREFQENIDVWEQQIEPRLKMSRDHAAQSASILALLSLASLALVFADIALHEHQVSSAPVAGGVAQTLLAIILTILLFHDFLPRLFFTRTRGQWVAHCTGTLRVLFFLVFPITLVLGFLTSIAALAESDQPPEQEDSAEAVEALIEAGQEEGILDESDRALVRSALEFGDKIVREVMTPRPAIFAVPAAMKLTEFSEQLRIQAYSRVPVYRDQLDDIVGIAFVHDLLHISDVDAANMTVGSIARPAMFTPETKNIQSLLREMQRDKQHMALVIDEYGGLAGLVTIEDVVEEIVGAISDEHETSVAEETAQPQPDGSYIVPGNFELAQLENLFDDSVSLPQTENYESTTIGGLVTEEAGRIPLPGEVIELAGLRLEVLASSRRRVNRVRVRPMEGDSARGVPAASH
ncbi:MAG: hemolysin family protein [Acidobacteriaceae bacterium]